MADLLELAERAERVASELTETQRSMVIGRDWFQSHEERRGGYNILYHHGIWQNEGSFQRGGLKTAFGHMVAAAILRARTKDHG